jgi:hypothetical protein
MMDCNSKPHDLIVDLYEKLHKNITRNSQSLDALKWITMMFESFYVKTDCIPYHQGYIYEEFLLAASKCCWMDGFPLETFIFTLEHVNHNLF